MSPSLIRIETVGVTSEAYFSNPIASQKISVTPKELIITQKHLPKLIVKSSSKFQGLKI